MSNYYICKDKKNGEVILLGYDLNKVYEVMPKVKKAGAIEVNKIVFVSSSFSEKIIKKKIEYKLKKLLLDLKESDDEGDQGGKVRNCLEEAERLKWNIINNYIKYLGKDYVNLILKKLQLVIDEYHKKMYIMRNNKYEELFMSMFSDNQERNSGRRGR